MILITVALIGLVFGSFITAVSYRIPRGEDFFIKRSRCIKCGHNLSVFDLFPVFSWILLRGKCRYCKEKVGLSYILIELLTAAIFVFIYLKMGITITSAIVALLAVLLIILTVIDFEHYIIPDGVNIAIFTLGIFYQLSISSQLLHFFIAPALSLVIGYLLRWLMWVWKKKEGLGMGDVKFFVAAGMFLQVEVIATFLFLSGVFGLVIGLFWRLTGKGERFPFGPALAMSLFVSLVFPEFQGWWQEIITGYILVK